MNSARRPSRHTPSALPVRASRTPFTNALQERISGVRFRMPLQTKRRGSGGETSSRGLRRRCAALRRTDHAPHVGILSDRLLGRIPAPTWHASPWSVRATRGTGMRGAHAKFPCEGVFVVRRERSTKTVPRSDRPGGTAFSAGRTHVQGASEKVRDRTSRLAGGTSAFAKSSPM